MQPQQPASDAPALTGIDLSEWAEQINEARLKNMTCLLATQDPDGYPDIAFKGSMMVFDQDHLAWWERSLGEQIAQVEKNPRIVVNYRNNETRQQLRFYGTAAIHKDGAMREAIMGRTLQIELDADPERKGYGVLVRVDRVRLGRNAIQERPSS